MSKSTKGTRSTNNFINHDSPKYIERSDSGRRKFGSSTNGTNAAHKSSFGILNAIETHSPGRPLSESSKHNLVKEMNQDQNLRIKSERGNKVLDERRDARIADAYVNDKPIEGKTTAHRAYQQFQGAQNLSNPKYAHEIGEMRVHDQETGGYYKVKNYEKHNHQN